MGLSSQLAIPAPPNKLWGIADDEKAVRAAIQRQHHRPRDESWSQSILRVRASHRKRVQQWQDEGKLSESKAARLLRCDCPNSKKTRRWRRPCEHPACPWCHYRAMLRLHRQLWHGMCQPELDRRRELPARSRPHTKMVLGMCETKVPHDQIDDHVADLRRRQIGRQMTRAGKIREGVVTTNIHRASDGYRVTIAVLGMSDRPVQQDQPQLPNRDGWKRLDDSTPCIEWRAAVRGDDAPIISVRQLFLLVNRAMPVVNDDSGVRIKRVSPVGAARSYVRSRGRFPKMIGVKSRRSPIPTCVIQEYVAERKERLNRGVVRAIIRRIGTPLGVPTGKLHALIGDFIRQSNRSLGGLHIMENLDTSADLLAEALALPIKFLPVVEYRLTLAGYLGPPSRGGPGWEAVVSWLYRRGDYDMPDQIAMPDHSAVLIRAPGHQRKIVAIHTQRDAIAWGDAERIRGTRAYVQPLDRFLDYVVAEWPDPVTDKMDFYQRIPRLAKSA